MKNYKVYPLFDITIERGEGCYVYDQKGEEYLDFYGGHAVISIGHSHPKYVANLTDQVNKIGFYSNSVKIPLQEELAQKLGQSCGYEDYHLFLCNSGAEANENALKLASFQNGRRKIVAFKQGFHGRTSLAVAATDSSKIQAAVNFTNNIQLLELGDLEGVKNALAAKDVACVIIEGIQGIGGINDPGSEFLEGVQEACRATETVFVLDEIQSGYGRTGKFFAHQYADIKPDIITIAKGMGNGFPVGGVIISPAYKASFGQLGTTFGGNHLACAAGLTVLEVMEEENLIGNAKSMGDYILSELKGISGIKGLRGKGLLLGLEFDEPVKQLRTDLLKRYKIFTGSSTNPNVLRLLPPMTITKVEADLLITALKQSI